MKIKPIETERLLLRGFTKDDAPFALSIWNDPDMSEYLPDPPCVDDAQKAALLKLYETLGDDDECCYLIAQDKITQEPIGTCSFIPYESGTYDIAYCVHKSKWQRGYASEIAKGLLDYARDQNAQSVTIWAAKGNTASERIAQKLGGIVVKEKEYCKEHTDFHYVEQMYEIRF